MSFSSVSFGISFEHAVQLPFTVFLYSPFPDNYAFLSLSPSQIKNIQSADTVPVHGHSPLVIIGDRQARESLINKFPTQLLGNSISPTDTVKNLGVIFDYGNTFSNHVTNMCRACYYHLKDLRRIRKFLSVETAALLANSMISSRLDYCNSLLYGISKYNVAKLQKIQNALCRIVFRLDRTSHVTPFLQKLHWLPITYRILFKYNLITFKDINFSQPIYLSSLIKTSCLTRGNRLSLSSASHKKAIGRRGFVVASPIEWNRLPQSVRSQQTITGFRSQLKTYLFRLAYPPP